MVTTISTLLTPTIIRITSYSYTNSYQFIGFRLSWETTTWNSPTGTPRDPPLAAHGQDQAKELANWLNNLPDSEKIHGIWSS